LSHTDRTLDQLLGDLGARTPAPGGGSAAAWATALAAALVEMAAWFSDRADTAARASELRAAALELAERELTAYEPVLGAMRLPKDDPARAEQLDRALSEAADSPRQIARTAGEVAELARELVRDGNRSLEGDANTAALLAEAAGKAATRLSEINLAQRSRS
jgi:methenyltetrahydrofolate cyclohydrolase